MPNLPRQPEVNIGTSGHVDHGKTTLVESITGIWTSAHSEELRRGITIKVGYADAAFYKCRSCPEPDALTTAQTCPHCGGPADLLRVVSFVDCPGHESLMANMLSGAALMDGAILVIAANEKVPQPQTREHLLALDMLGTKNLVVVQNKVDLVTKDAALSNCKAIKSFIKGTLAEGSPIIPISAQQRLNIGYLIQALQEYIPTPKRDVNARPLMQVLRSFDINKPGSKISSLKGGVVGGTLVAGELKVGDEVELIPGIPDRKTSKYHPIRSKIESLGTGAGLVEKVSPGGLIAVATKLDPDLTKGDALVGSLLGLPGELPPVHEDLTLEVNLFEMAVGAPELVKVDKIQANELLRLNIGTAVTIGAVTSVRDNIVEIKLRRPVAAALGARAAIARRITDRWRLIGSGVLK